MPHLVTYLWSKIISFGSAGLISISLYLSPIYPLMVLVGSMILADTITGRWTADRNLITINGVDYANNVETNSPNLAGASGNLTVGRTISGGARFKGQIHEIIIANRALNNTELAQAQQIIQNRYGTLPM